MSLVLPISDWPAADRDLWHGLFVEGNPLDDRGSLVHLRQTSRYTLAKRYGRWLAWLSVEVPEALALDPIDRPTFERLKRWLKTLDHVSPMTRSMFVDGVLRVTTAAAPNLDWSAQKDLKARLKHAAGRGDPRRKQGRVLSSATLFDAGAALSDEANARPDGSLFRATGLRDAAMITLLALMPMRRRALAGLSLGQSVFVAGERITVALPAELTKNNKPWEADVPMQSLPFLQAYLTAARPTLAVRGRGEDRSLWLDRNGRGLQEDYLGRRIAEQTLQVTGIRVPPHFFRDAAATTLTRISPQAARLIRPVLGHSGFATAERHYIHAQRREAGRVFATLVSELKRDHR